jgi:hypothetical protein
MAKFIHIKTTTVMTLFHPGCTSTAFFYNTIGKTGEGENAEIVDHMKCKKCNFEFDITWYDYIRNEWLSENQPRIFKRK